MKIYTVIFIIFIWVPLVTASETISYKESRYLEDYSYLYNTKKSFHFFDPIKYIPLTKNGGSYLSFGGETRQHFEQVKNDNWGATSEDTNGYYLQRYMIHGDLHLDKSNRFFTQIKSGIELGRKAGPRVVDENKLDLHQAFFDHRWYLKNSQKLTLRVGRQEMFYGARRFINYRERPNVRLSFDGVKLVWDEDTSSLSVFATKAVEIDPGVFDDNLIDGPSLWGGYAVFKKMKWIHGNFDLYYFGLERDLASFDQGTAYEMRHSVGFRWWDEFKNIDYDFEFIYQFGRFGDGDIRAFTFASDTGYTLKFYGNNKIRFSFRGDISSGDQDLNDFDLGTFNLQFGKGKHLGQLSPYGPVNLYEVHPKATLFLSEKYKILAMWEFLWRQSVADGIYSIANSLLKTGSQSRARYVGNNAILEATWYIDRNLSIAGFFSYFFAGTFLKETPPGNDIRYTAAYLVYKF